MRFCDPFVTAAAVLLSFGFYIWLMLVAVQQLSGITLNWLGWYWSNLAPSWGTSLSVTFANGSFSTILEGFTGRDGFEVLETRVPWSVAPSTSLTISEVLDEGGDVAWFYRRILLYLQRQNYCSLELVGYT
ncbi:hypothetical protein PGB90_003573 [Kerria lacca]